ncbi:MAG: DUF2817 domain-containing protein [Pseudomonadota bacterium]
MAKVPDLSATQFFASTYAKARKAFLAGAEGHGAIVCSYIQPGITGPTGEALAIDTAWFGAKDAACVHVALSGTHGLEFACGSAGQMQWMASGEAETLPDDVAVLLIHAVNPYGAACRSRTNADHVDLNRNFRRSTHLRKPPAVYAKAKAAITLRGAHIDDLYALQSAFDALMETENPGDVMIAIAGGQDVDPDGPAYGGGEPSWETATLLQIIEDQLQDAQQVAIVDWHTGLGPHGEASLIFNHPEGSEEYKLGCAWWGEPAKAADLYDAGTAPVIEGEVSEGMAEALQATGCAAVTSVIEIGTFDNRALLPAFAIDRWLRANPEAADSPEGIRMQTLMAEWYSPSLPSWREMALAQMARIYRSTISGLAEWSEQNAAPVD